MKELLHSKGFKKNLRKWLFMYCSVMCVLTIVVTYSRYISSKAVDDSARAAKFDVSIKPVECSKLEATLEANYTCFDGKLEESRPTDYVNFYYTVDTSNLEVSTKLVTTIHIHNKKVAVINPEDEVINPTPKYFSDYKLYDANNEPVPKEIDGDKIIVTEDILAGNGSVKQYRLTMKYNYQSVGYASEKLVDSLISIDYAAKQID